MIARTTTRDSGTTTVSGCDRLVRPDSACWAKACEFLVELIGSPPDDLLWDDTHRLQGHGHLQGCELIVIACRDDDHQPVVLTAEDWGAVRRASADQRRELLKSCVIASHDQLVAVLGHHKRASKSCHLAA